MGMGSRRSSRASGMGLQVADLYPDDSSEGKPSWAGSGSDSSAEAYRGHARTRPKNRRGSEHSVMHYDFSPSASDEEAGSAALDREQSTEGMRSSRRERGLHQDNGVHQPHSRAVRTQSREELMAMYKADRRRASEAAVRKSSMKHGEHASALPSDALLAMETSPASELPQDRMPSTKSTERHGAHTSALPPDAMRAMDAADASEAVEAVEVMPRGLGSHHSEPVETVEVMPNGLSSHRSEVSHQKSREEVSVPVKEPIATELPTKHQDERQASGGATVSSPVRSPRSLVKKESGSAGLAGAEAAAANAAIAKKDEESAEAEEGEGGEEEDYDYDYDAEGEEEEEGEGWV